MARVPQQKVKIAKRVIDVFRCIEEFDRPITVMDLVRRFGHPQSSASELMSSLVDMGMLYKDAASRSFTPTPRLAVLGSFAQPEMIRNGRTFNDMDRLSSSTGRTLALFGMSGPHAHVFRWSRGAAPDGQKPNMQVTDLLCASAAGLLLLSTLSRTTASGMLWRLKGQTSGPKLDHGAMMAQVDHFRRQGYATGEGGGFNPGARMVAILLPAAINADPLALGMFYSPDEDVDPDALVTRMIDGLSLCAPAIPHVRSHVATANRESGLFMLGRSAAPEELGSPRKYRHDC